MSPNLARQNVKSSIRFCCESVDWSNCPIPSFKQAKESAVNIYDDFMQCGETELTKCTKWLRGQNMLPIRYMFILTTCLKMTCILDDRQTHTFQFSFKLNKNAPNMHIFTFRTRKAGQRQCAVS
ncbi:hypothetical protein XU18_3961 [Perkinsela sp. CCAP 1560/4]|nr:hypothetical protein XU18_3961 [Perkinsela sp. CCAP 1560/4]|eukprot:KNH04903.1 hypothetical protein XU18_3961 [Perkinsela sp. CCAP 1560/4]